MDRLADRLRQIEIELAEIRQHTAKHGVGVHSPYGELLDAGSLVMSAANKLRLIEQKGGSYGGV